MRLSKAGIALWALTFALTVLADLRVAVEVGMVLAALLYIYRISQTTVAPVQILRIHGPFLFGTTEKLAEAMADLGAFPPVVVVRL